MPVPPTPITAAITASKSVGPDMDWISIICGANRAGERRSAFEWCKLRLYFNIKPINTIIISQQQEWSNAKQE